MTICIGRPIIETLARDGAWTSETGESLVAASDLFGQNPYATWQPIDTAPKDGRSAVLAINVQHEHVGMVMFNAQGEWEALSTRGAPIGIGFYPTHWMPLPKPPRPTEQGA